MVEKVDPLKPNMVVGIETTHGYFKLDLKLPTKLDLKSGFDKSRVMWLYFTAFKPQNPHRRAWLHAIRGPAFGKPRIYGMVIKLQSFSNVLGQMPQIHISYPNVIPPCPVFHVGLH